MIREKSNINQRFDKKRKKIKNYVFNHLLIKSTGGIDYDHPLNIPQKRQSRVLDSQKQNETLLIRWYIRLESVWELMERSYFSGDWYQIKEGLHRIGSTANVYQGRKVEPFELKYSYVG